MDWNTWGSFGIDLALGSVIDQNATPEEYMFLPSYIHTFFEDAMFKTTNTALVKESKTIFQQKTIESKNNFLISPIFILGLIGIAILFITYKDFKSNRRTKWLDITLFVLTGIIGIVILLLWFATDHKATHNNYNLLWAFALNVFVVGQLIRSQVKLWFIKYLKLLVILLCLLTLHWIIGVQVFSYGVIPLLEGLFTRYLFLIIYLNRLVTAL